jgi:hypothetical protein
MDRRAFLQLLAGASLGSGLGCSKETEPLFSAPPWGGTTAKNSALLLPESARPEGILEVYLMGGMNPFDTFYAVPDYGRPNDPNYPRQQWWTFQEGNESVSEIFDLCGGGSRDLLVPYAYDSAGRTAGLGPWLYPLRDRPDILDRMRVLVMHHEFEPHQVATPLALCGHPRGTPRMASTGAHLERFFRLRDEPERGTPFSYVLYSEDTETAAEFNIHAASASGLHPSYARPLAIRLMADNPLPEQLSRSHLKGYDRQVDDAVRHYLKSYAEALRVPGSDLMLPARAYEELDAARRSLGFSNELGSVLLPELLAPISGGECGMETDLDTPAMGLKLAAELLTRESNRARYCNYVDSGIINAEGSGYDTHDHHVVESSRNIVHTCRMLASVINKPGENDPNKLDLDRHQVLITTEFGRTPYEELNRIRGLNHWPFGYTVVAIGGFVGQEQAGIAGAMGPDGRATESFTPAEFRAALLLAMGIWPFSNESFAIGDVRGAKTEAEAARLLRSALLGYPV